MASPTPVLRAWRRIPGPPRDRDKARLLRLYRALHARWGPPAGWPGRMPYEVAAGVILAQHTARTDAGRADAATLDAARALAALRRRGRLTARAVHRTSERELADVIRSAGTPRPPARRLKAFTRWLVEGHGGRFERLRRTPLEPLRRDLLQIPGLESETVDAILLHAAGRAVFVADPYARRALARHGFVSAAAGYEQVRAFVEAHLPSDPALLGEFRMLLCVEGGLPSEGGSAPLPNLPPRLRGQSPRSERRVKRTRR